MFRVGGQAVDHLAGAGVVELLARLVLDRIGVVLEPVNVLLEAGVFVLKLLDLVFELFLLTALAVPGG